MEKVYGITMLLLGITSLFFGIAIIYFAGAISGLIQTVLSVYPGITSFEIYIALAWVFGILETVLGIFAIISAIKIFSENE